MQRRHKFMIFFAVILITMVPLEVASAVDATSAQELGMDAPQSADYPLLGRYDGSHLLAQTVKAYDELTVPAGPAVGESFDSNKKFSATQTMQGKVIRSIYIAPAGRSSLEVFDNYKNILVKNGFTPIYTCAEAACGPSFMHLKYRWDNKKALVLGANYSDIRNHLIEAVFDNVKDIRYALAKKSDPKGDTYVAMYVGLHVDGAFGDYSHALKDRVGVLTEVVEPKAMENNMVTLKSAEIVGDLGKSGRAVFYGIFFDFGKADLKPESEPQLVEMAKALSENPQLKVFIVGHTDNVGKLEDNVVLSQRRAEAVQQALVAKYHVDSSRLTAKGLASLAPVASNHSDAGRAKNRRVEMVER